MMREDNNNMDDLLWNYIDQTLDAGAMKDVEERIRSNAEWQKQYAELLHIHQLMQDHVELEAPSMRFTQNVMEEIARLQIAPATKNYINKYVILGIFLFFLTTIIGLLGYGLGQVDWSKPSPDSEPWSPLSSFDWSSIFNSTYMNIFLMVNIVLGLMLLDMYLTRKKRSAGN